MGCGFLFYIISPPLSAYPLQWVVWAPLYLMLRHQSTKRSFLLGWLSGVGLNLAGFYWIVHTIVVFSNLPIAVAIPVLFLFAAYGGLPFGLFGILLPKLQARFGPWSILLAPVGWVAIEFVFPLIFPFHQGDFQYRWLAILQVGTLTGVYGISYLVIASNVALAEVISAYRNATTRPWAPTAILATLMLAGTLYGSARIDRLQTAMEEHPQLKVGLIQGNFGVQDRRALTRADIFARYRRLTEEAVRSGARLVIWGEGASPYAPHRSKGWAKVERLIKKHDIALITGGPGRGRRDGKTLYFNSAYGMSSEEVESHTFQRYDKQILLAFGEYMPGARIFPWLKGKIQGIGDYTPGEGPGLIRFNVDGTPIQALLVICYEAILESFVQEQSAQHPNLLVNITHDAWFGDTSCPHQFLMLVTSRAVEQGATVVRIANTGITAIIDPTGQIRGETPLFEQAVLVDNVTTQQFPTLFQRLGNWFAWLCLVMGMGSVGILWRDRKDFPANG